MNRSIAQTPSNRRVFGACLLSFAILITPIAALAGPGNTLRTPVKQASVPPSTTASSTTEVFANPPALPAPPPVVATVTASLVDSIENDDADNKIDPTNGNPLTTERILYTATISNSGTDATGLKFTAPLDSHTTFVGGSIDVSPLAGNDTYSTIGNTLLEVGSLAAPSSSPKITVTGSVFDNDTEFLSDSFTLKSLQAVNFVSGTVTASSTNGGTVVMEGTNGRFSYLPPAGNITTDTFTYTITDDGTDGISGNADDLTNTATVTINFSGNVWYVKNNQAAGGLGRSTDPFDTLLEAQTASVAGDTIYVFNGNNTTSGQNLGITLKANQRFVGEGVQLDVPVSVNGGPNPTVLRAAGTAPQVTNTGGNDVTVTNISGVSIRGCNFVNGGASNTNAIAVSFTAAGGGVTISNNSITGGTANAIDVTTSGAAAGGSVTIANNAITGAGAEGIDINANGTGTLTADVNTNTLNATGNAFDASENAGALNLNFSSNTGITGADGVGSAVNIVRVTGTLTITGFANNQVSGSSTGTGINVSNAIFDASPAAGFQQVSGGATVIGAVGNGVGDSGLVLSGMTGDLSFTDLDIVNDGGTGLSVAGGGQLNAGAGTGTGISVGAGVGTIASVGGPAVNVSSATADLQLTSVTSTNSGSQGVALTSVNGTFSAGSGSTITTATGTDFDISGGTANITYNGTITDDLGTLVSISGATGGTKSFTGAITDGDDGDGSGISLTSNGGTTIRFSGGVVLSTGANPAFTATGGAAAVEVCDENPCNPAATGALINKITTTSGTALNVTSTTIGANNLEFRSISAGTAASGPANGIVLNTTGAGGGLKVKGTGSAGTGGTIRKCATGVSLTSAQNVSLSWMQLNDFTDWGVRGFSGNVNFSMDNTVINGTNGDSPANDDGPVRFTGLTGTGTFTNDNISGSVENNMVLVNTTGTLTLNITGSTYGPMNSSTGDDGLLIEPQGTAVINASITNSFFTAAEGDLFNFVQLANNTSSLTFTGNTLTNNHPGIATGGGGVTIGGGDNGGSLNFTINNNSFRDAHGIGVFIFKSTGAGTYSGTFNNNTIGVVAVANSGSLEGDGVKVQNAGSGTVTIHMDSNQIRQYNNMGIELLAGGGATPQSGNLNATITGNTISNPGNNPAIDSDKNGIHLNSGTVVGDTYSICLSIGGAGALRNTIVGSGAPAPVSGGGSIDFRLRQRQSTTVRLPGYGGASTDTAAVIAFVQGNNNLGGTPTGLASTQAPGGGFVGGAACPLLLAMGGITPSQDIFPLIRSFDFSALSSMSVSTPSPVSDSLTQPQLDSIVRASIQRWSATGLTQQQIARLSGIKFEVSDLSGAYLGEAYDNRIQVDRNAFGRGWFVDVNPLSGATFARAVSATRFYTYPGNAAAGHVDLLTAIEHEMGHRLGLDDSYAPKDRDSIMYGYLTVGERRLPANGQAKGAGAGALSGPHFLTLGSASPDRRANDWGTSPRVSKGVEPQSGEMFIANHVAPTTASLAPMFAGETVTFDNGGAGITLPAGKSITITFKATLNDPPNVINNPYPAGGPQVSTQGTVSGSNFANVLTDDPAVGGATDPTVTLVDLYNSATDITPNSSPTITEGDPVTYTATVTPNQAGSPTTLSGNVTFFDGVSPIAGCTNVALTGVAPYTASCTTSALTAAGSPHSINAVYNGDGNFDTSTDPAAITQVVIPCNGAPVVTKIADTNDGVCDADCSLREAIAVACAGSTITFNAAGVFSTPQTITLSLGELSVTRNLTIDGPDAAANHVTVNGGGASRVFHIQPGKTDTIRDLTVTGGLASGSFPANSGGGIYNDLATLSLINMTVSGNTATFGGGVYNSGNGGTASLTVTNSTLSGNTATTHGGAIYNDGIGAGTAILAIINSTISGNKANGQGGGVLTIGSTASTTVTTTNATITNNTADFDDTSGSDNGGGLFVGSGPDVRLRNTIIAGNFRGTTTPIPDNIQGANVNITALSSNNLIGTGGAGGLTNGVNFNQVGVANPGLGPLANNGGQTQTHNLLFGSPAIEAGSNTFSDAVSLTTDQRGTGFIRKADSADAGAVKTVDIGAIEAQVTIEDITDKSTPEDTPLAFSFNVGDDGQILTVAATSSNTGLVSNANAVITGAGSTRTLTLTPTANQFGTTTITVTVTSTVASGSQTMQDTFVLTVTAVGDQPTISSATTPEDTQTTSGLQITKSVNDGAEVAFFKITNITNGLLFKNDGTTPIINNQVITEAEGNAGLKFTPAANLFSPGTSFSFQAQGATDGLGNGTGAAGTGTITVTPVADTPTVSDATTLEDTQTSTNLVITRNVNDGAEVTHFKITGITGGTLFKHDGVTVVGNGTFVTVAEASNVGGFGLKFTPSPNLFSPTTPFFGFTVQASTSNADAGLGGNLVNATVTVNPVADTPSVTDATTQVNTQTATGLVIIRNPVDSTEVTHFKITGITNGTLYKHDGTTVINNNDFILVSDAADVGGYGLKFTPTAGLFSPGSTFKFDIQASTSNVNGGLGGSVITANITVNPALTLTVNITGDAPDLVLDNICDTDSGTVGNQCSLRAAIQESNFASSDDTINFSLPANSTISLLTPLDAITGNVTITGPGANTLTVERNSGAADFRIFNVTAPGTTSISGLTLKDGKATGGGVLNQSGGGILFNSNGTLNIVSMTFTNNLATAGGGGLNNIGGGTVNVINSLFTLNSANGGGAMDNSGSGILNVTNSTLNGNIAGAGGGGAIFHGGTAITTLTNCTVSSNTATGGGGGIHVSAGSATLKNTIVAYNTTNSLPSDLSGPVNADYSLIGNTTGAGTITGGNNQVNVDPLLGALANNGGPTQTRALGLGSLALDSGNNAYVTAPPFINVVPITDQRGTGFPRIMDAADADTTQTVDMGAFEARAAVEDITDKSTPVNTPLSFSFNVGDASQITTVTATSANSTLVPNAPANISVTGSGSSRMLNITPAANEVGTSVITVTVTSGTESMSDTFTLTVTPVADIQVTKSDSPDPVTAGTNISYAISMTNNGPNPAQTVTLTDAVPANTTFVSFIQNTGPSFSCTDPGLGGTGNVSCTLATMASGATATFTMIVNVNANTAEGTTITNNAVGGSATADNNSGNNTGTATTNVIQSDIEITSKTDLPDPVTAGNNLQYTIIFKNNSAVSTAANVTVTDAIPVGTTLVGATTISPGWARTDVVPAGGTGNIVFSKALVAGSETAVFTIVVKVDTSVTNGTIITNTATAATTSIDTINANNSASATTTVNASADLQITSKTDVPDPVIAGNNITYTINFQNNGPSDAQTVTVTDAVPANTTFVSAAIATGTGWSITDPGLGNTGNVVFSKATVAAGETASFTVVVKVNASTPAATIISNDAVAATATTDPTPANNTGNATTTVNRSADLAVTKGDAPDPVVADANLTYTLNFVNNGPSDASTVTVTDAVPANTTFFSASVTNGAGWSISAPAVGGTGNVVFSKGTVAAGETAVFQVVVKVNASAVDGSTISNSATAATTTTDPDNSNNTGTATTTVTNKADVSITKSDAPDPVVVGTNITYTLNFANNGPATANTVTVTDAVPVNTTFFAAIVTTGSGWSISAPAVGGTGNVIFSRASVPSGETAVFTIVVNVNPGTPHNTVITNTAVAGNTTVDPDSSNNTAVTTTTVTSTLALTVNDSGDAADNNVGDRICDTNAAPGDQCTLRAAIQETNAAVTNDTIDFSLPANTTIVLLSALPDINGGHLVMTGPASGVTVSGNNLYRVFNVVSGNVQLLNLTIANGQASQGGGIFNSGNLTITNSTLTGNKAVGSEGGGIYSNNGTLTIINSTISGNTSDGVGGGLANAGTSSAVLVNVTITNNRADADGNGAGNGGGISQVSSNAVILINTIVAGNFVGLSPGTVADDINGTVAPAGNNNLIGTGGSGGLTNGVNNNQVGVVDARLGVLANNGGPTQTHALLSGSVALDTGDDSVTGGPYNLTTDQRGPGFPRKADGPDANTTQTVDIGAFEADPSVEDISDKSTNEDTALPTFVFNVGDAATPFTSITATSSNTTLVPNANIVVGPDTASTRTLSITPAANEFGTTTITVTATKIIGGNPVSFSDTFILTVNGVNDPPSFTKGPDQTVAEDSGAQSVANWATAISPGPGNESGQTLTFLVQNNTNPGLFSAGPAISPTGTLTYTPAANANGTATITIALMDNGGGTDTSASQSFQITVTEVNDAPDAVDDALSSVAEDSGQRTISIASLLANDSKGPANESGQTLTLTSVSNPVGGTVSKDAVNVVFTPTADFNGPASFQYTVTDNGTTNGAADPKQDTATVSFTVTEVNDAPTAVSETIPNLTEDSPQSIPFATLTANDVKGPANESGQTLIVKTVGNPVGGTVSINILAGNVVFTPTANYTGPGSFDYTVEDNGTTNGVADPKTSGVATASFTITSVNDAPVAVNDTLTSMAEDAAPRAIPFADLTANDSKGGPDESGQTLTVVSVGNAVGGSVLLVPGFVVFTPNGDYNGPASFTYTVQDNGTTNGAPDPKTSGSALVQFTITEVNDAPSAFNDTLPDVAQNSGERTIAFADLLANDVKGPADESGQTLTILTVGNPVGVTVSIVAGTVRVTPLPDFAGPAGFQYTVRDNGTTSGFGDEKTSVATVSFNVIGQGGGGGVLRFSAANYSVAEGAGFRTITVERTGDSSQAVTVDYASSDHSNPADFIPCSSPGVGFASSRCDFTTAIGTLRFAAGETSKTFNVLISNDNYVEGPETLELTLSNPTGGAVFGVPQTAILTINDDLSEPGTNPIDTSSEFVRSQYHDFLNREPDAPGLAFWTDNIELCNDASRRPVGQTIAQCIDKQRESTAVAFFAAPEFQITGGFVYNLYKGSLTGAPNYDGGSPGASPGRFPTSLEFMRDVGQVSEGIVVNNAISGAVVEANRNRLAAEFVQRPEFIIKYGGLNNTLYVDELFNTTGIVATAAQKQALVDGLTGGTETRASVLRKVVDGTVVISEGNVQFTTSYGQAFINQENRRKFVFMEYIAYLRRNPDTPGFVFWLGKLNFYNGDPFQAEMVRSFILSPEYRNRFGQP